MIPSFNINLTIIISTVARQWLKLKLLLQFEPGSGRNNSLNSMVRIAFF
jgi:hypothetical protein